MPRRPGGEAPKPEASRAVFLACLVLATALAAFLAGMLSGVTRNAAYDVVAGTMRDVMLVGSEIDNVLPDGEPVHFLQPARQEGEGVVIDEALDDGAAVLLSGFFADAEGGAGGDGLRLIRPDGTVIARWDLSFSRHFPESPHLGWRPATDWNIDIHGAALNPDGSVVFNYEYGGSAKMTACGETAWILPRQTHHSVTRAEGGGYWIPGRRFIHGVDGDVYPPFTAARPEEGIAVDGILRVSEDGRVTREIPVPDIFYDNGLEAQLTATGYPFETDGVWFFEMVHLNKIAELSTARAPAFPMFEAGDLLLSLRTYNMLLVVDPDDWRVKWRRTGPWLRQHDPEFAADGTIRVFDNAAYSQAQIPPYGRADPEAPLVSRILAVRPADRRSQEVVEVVYGGRPEEGFRSVIRGKQQTLPDGSVLITEFEAGRAFIADPQGRVTWDYINRYDETRVLELTGARAYPADYLEGDPWADCPAE